ncbi:MAG: hypothetical protein KAS87_05320 [Candidatus Omnitrophica bacterium]|nr:hypothetical protein [Candidatus Omnitrophota bacterium]
MSDKIIDVKEELKKKKENFLSKQTELADTVEGKIDSVLSGLENALKSLDQVEEIDVTIKLKDGTELKLKKAL